MLTMFSTLPRRNADKRTGRRVPAPRKPCLEALEDRYLLSVNLALNPSRAGYPNPLESDHGWGGGSDPWEIVDGQRSYSDWAHGLAFTGGPNGWGGESGGMRQATINFGTMETFDKATIWWHGQSYTPGTTSLQFFDGSNWKDISFSRSYGRFHESGDPVSRSGYADSDEYTFAAVTGSEIRLTLNDLDPSIVGTPMVHGWIYEFEVYSGADINLHATGTTLTTTTGRRFAAVVTSFQGNDPSPGIPLGYTALIDWGDGSRPSTGGISDNGDGTWDVAGSHTYATAGTYTMSDIITYGRPGGPSTTATTTIIVTDPAPPPGGNGGPSSAILHEPLFAQTSSTLITNGSKGCGAPVAGVPAESRVILAPLPAHACVSESVSNRPAFQLSHHPTATNLGEPTHRLSPGLVDLLAENMLN
jgi:hypothetical protein